jgi:flagellum-specific ATP synthase
MSDGAAAPEGAFARVSTALSHATLVRRNGYVSNLIGLIIETTGLRAEMGELCLINAGRFRRPVGAEVVGFREGRTLLMPLGDLQGIGPGTKVIATGAPFRVEVGDALLGRVLDGLGRPLAAPRGEAGSADAQLTDGAPADGAPADGAPSDDSLADAAHAPAPSPEGRRRYERRKAALRSTMSSPPDPLSRPRISQRVGLGVRALDTLVPCGRGQRLGIFSGSGVGKSSLMGMIARSSAASVNVIALVGERGREVGEFIERDLGPGLERSVVIVATSDQPALVRIRAAFTATTIAEHFRDQGHDVMLMMDSITRFAMAQREVGLAIGEPPATRGYTPSVFALLPRLLERAGTNRSGSITGLYTVLVDGDDMNEPIADAVRAILDGHIVLSRPLAHAGHYPAIDVLQSVSRLAGQVTEPAVAAAAGRVRAALARMRDKEDLIAIGAYQSGSDPELDAALAQRHRIEQFLRQPVEEASDAAGADAQLIEIAAALEETLAQATGEAGEEVVDGEALPDPMPPGAAGGGPGSPGGPPGSPGGPPGAPAIPLLQL